MVEQEILGLILSKLDDLQTGQKEMAQRLDRVEQELRETRILVENTLPSQIQLIAEQHSTIIEKLDRMEDYDQIKSRVSTLEQVVQSQAAAIHILEQQMA